MNEIFRFHKRFYGFKKIENIMISSVSFLIVTNIFYFSVCISLNSLKDRCITLGNAFVWFTISFEINNDYIKMALSDYLFRTIAFGDLQLHKFTLLRMILSC